ncbi:DNA replication and repair protein RecF, partial [Patescibacteria group bacterium]|nr:DNA replication and repair protein RecF [Patescibacteria group bacterium]
KEFDFSSGITVVIGPNASGKTNLLEAIHLLATGRSLRAQIEAEMISYGEELARVEGMVKNQEGEKDELTIVLTVGEVAGEKVAKKRYLINGVAKRMIDFVGNLRSVYFGPEDLNIIFDSPSQRRDYLNSILEPVDREYRRASLSYQKGLRQRNKLLEQIRDEGRPHSILFFWNKLLLENGEIITRKREELITFINQQPQRFFRIQIHYDKSIISPQRLKNYTDAEIAAGMTLVGPHRDDFQLQAAEDKETKRNLHRFGSRGEQRMAVFSLKLAEFEFVIQKTEERPVLLLDDIFSELDQEHRKRLLVIIPKQQTIITTTDIHLIEPEYRQKLEIIRLR